MTQAELESLLNTLRQQDSETEWLEFKVNDSEPNDIGEYISALSNSAGFIGRESAYLVWGIADGSHEIVGTAFQPRKAKIGNQELENWLSGHLTPSVDFRFHELTADNKAIVLLVIQPCQHTPVRWKDIEYIRVGSYKKKLKDYPEKERILWNLLSQTTFEKGIALRGVSEEEVLQLLNYAAYFDLTRQSLPQERRGILERFEQERMVVAKSGRQYDITNFGALLFAKKLSSFERLGRKAVRVISYSGENRILADKEFISDAGYAVGFEAIVSYINSQLPSNEHIGQALRVETPMYPSIAIRELVANAIIHQDLNETGVSPIVDIFPERLEITNPGRPLIPPLRFVDEPPKSRNEALAAFMRRIKICEERGSGIDKVMDSVESFQLPAPDITQTDTATRVILFAKRDFKEMSSQERIRACYWHACLLYVSGKQMTNETLRKRLGLEDTKHNQVGRIISDARKADQIKPYDPDNRSPRYARYIPFWA